MAVLLCVCSISADLKEYKLHLNETLDLEREIVTSGIVLIQRETINFGLKNLMKLRK